MKIFENEKNYTILGNEDKIYFLSYDKTIAIYDNTTKTLKLNAYYWNYTQTTLKQLKHFINTYTCYHYESKKLFEIETEENSKIEMIINLH